MEIDKWIPLFREEDMEKARKIAEALPVTSHSGYIVMLCQEREFSTTTTETVPTQVYTRDPMSGERMQNFTTKEKEEKVPHPYQTAIVLAAGRNSSIPPGKGILYSRKMHTLLTLNAEEEEAAGGKIALVQEHGILAVTHACFFPCDQ